MLRIELEKRGCNFYGQPETAKSDVGNYLVTTRSEEVEGKDGKVYFLEFSHWNRWRYRTTNKRTGEPLKKAVRELVNENALHVNTQFSKEDGSSWGNIALEAELADMNLDYTLDGIRKACEYITGKPCEIVIL